MQTRYNSKEKKLEEEKRDLELEYKNKVVISYCGISSIQTLN
jgi:hypothetical protein